MQVSIKPQDLIENPNTIDSIRILAEKTGKYAGQVGPFWCDTDGIWTEVWLQDVPPAAAKVGILRQDFKKPIFTTARMSSFFKTTAGALTEFCKNPDIMIANIAEALAFRRAFPSEMSEIITESVTESTYSTESDVITLQDNSGEITAEPIVEPSEGSTAVHTTEPSVDPAEPIEPKPATLTTEQVERIQTLLNEVGSDGKKLLNHFSCEKLEQLPATAFEEIIKALEIKKAEISQAAKSKVDEGDNSTTAQNSSIQNLDLKQIENIKKMMTDTSTDEAKFLAHLNEKSMNLIPAKRYGEIIGLLEAKRKALQAQSQPQSQSQQQETASVSTGNEVKRTINDTISMLAVKNIELRLSTDGLTIFAKSFNEKDFLKQIGFKWDAAEKAWAWTE